MENLNVTLCLIIYGSGWFLGALTMWSLTKVKSAPVRYKTKEEEIQSLYINR